MNGQLDTRQGEIMDILGRRGQERVTVAEVAAELGVVRQSVVRTMTSLYELHLIVLERGAGANRYRLSDHGRAVQANREASRRFNQMRGGG